MSTYNPVTGEYHLGFVERVRHDSRAVFANMFAHESQPEGNDDWRWRPSEEVRAHNFALVDGTAKVGDLLVRVENTKRQGDWYDPLRYTAGTLRNAVERGTLVRVVKVTAKMFAYVNIGSLDSLGYLGNENFLTLVDPERQQYVERAQGNSQSTTFYALGNVEAIQGMLDALPEYQQNLVDRVKARAIVDRLSALQEAARKAERAQKQDTYRASRKAAKAINKATGRTIYYSKDYGNPSTALTSYGTGFHNIDGDAARLMIYGRLHLAEITAEQAAKALQALADFNETSV